MENARNANARRGNNNAPVVSTDVCVLCHEQLTNATAVPFHTHAGCGLRMHPECNAVYVQTFAGYNVSKAPCPICRRNRDGTRMGETTMTQQIARSRAVAPTQNQISSAVREIRTAIQSVELQNRLRAVNQRIAQLQQPLREAVSPILLMNRDVLGIREVVEHIRMRGHNTGATIQPIITRVFRHPSRRAAIRYLSQLERKIIRSPSITKAKAAIVRRLFDPHLRPSHR